MGKKGECERIAVALAVACACSKERRGEERGGEFLAETDAKERKRGWMMGGSWTTYSTVCPAWRGDGVKAQHIRTH